MKDWSHLREIEEGDRVMYSSEFLRNIGLFYGPICFVRGIVTEVDLITPGHPTRLVTVLWTSFTPGYKMNDEEGWIGTKSRILSSNLEFDPFKENQ